MTATLEMPLIADPLAVLRGRGKRQDGFSYKLSTAEYGLDVILPEQLDIDENKMSVWIPFADGNRRDGVGDLLEVGGIRTDRHRSNPIVLFDHGKNVNLPIALAEEPETKAYSVVIDPITKSARANAYFYKGTGILGTNKGQEYEHALFCEQLFDLIAKRYIRAGSIGYQVIKALNLQPDYDTGAPQGLHLLVTLMLELSAVVLPANGDTVRKVLCMDGCCGKPLSPMLVKSLTPYASEEKVQIDSGIKAIPESSDKEIVAIPHGDMSKTDVPPVKWKPGLGAEKSKSIPGDLHWLNEEKKRPPFGIVALEAMAMGCPLLCTEVDGLGEIVVDEQGGEHALIIPSSDSGAIVEGLRMLGNDDARFELRQLGLQRVKAFTWDAAVERTIAVYREALHWSGRRERRVG